MTSNSATIQHEASRRRTFAIISHPDAGKTTLTEKLLLYSGAIQTAGSVKARANQRKATSDWMELEKQRGISVTSTVLQFPYRDYVLNLLDTPGHNDFSADTYRTLTAADSAVMIVDYAKGVEAQTRKLFDVCRRREIPIFTFVNKLDHDGLGPLDVMADIEDALGMVCVPMNWPIGEGVGFVGVVDRASRTIHFFQRTAHGSSRAESSTMSLDDPAVPDRLGQAAWQRLQEDLDLLDHAHVQLDLDLVKVGKQSPMFFGSALTNFGVEPFLNAFLALAPAPNQRPAGEAEIAAGAEFSAFVFKIQANMNPEHRDRIAFMRIVTGEFEKDMEVVHSQSGKPMRLTRPQRVFAHERETIESAFPGDIIGIPNPGHLRLGDTLAVQAGVRYDEVPAFTPELFASISNIDPTRFKHFDKGVVQLAAEGLIDLYYDPRADQRLYILGAVGMLQFDVVKFRMEFEYGVRTQVAPLPQTHVRWLVDPDREVAQIYLPPDVKSLRDAHDRPVLLFNTPYQVQSLAAKLKAGRLLTEAPDGP